MAQIRKEVVINVDEEYEFAYLYLPEPKDRQGIVHQTVSVRCLGNDLNLDFDKGGQLIGIEFLIASLQKDLLGDTA